MKNLISSRSLSLDIFKGIAVFFMVFVNMVYDSTTMPRFLTHPHWDGVSFADFIFPVFLFSSGLSLFYASRKASSDRNLKTMFLRIFRIFGLGVIINIWYYLIFHFEDLSTFHFSEFRVMGLLQRLALSLLMAELAVRYLSFRIWQRLVFIIFIGFIPIHTVIFSMEDPLGSFQHWFNCQLFADTQFILVGPGEGIRVEPDGLIDAILSFVNVSVGYFFGVYVFERNKKGDLIILSIIAILVALIASIAVPLNRTIWSPTFSLLSSGVCALAFIYIQGVSNKGSIGWCKTWLAILGRHSLFYFFAPIMIVPIWVFPFMLVLGPTSWWLNFMPALLFLLVSLGYFLVKEYKSADKILPLRVH